MFLLVSLFSTAVVASVTYALTGGDTRLVDYLFNAAEILLLCAYLLLCVPITVRRCHDIGIGGLWAVLVLLIPGGSTIIGLLPSAEQPNRYGSLRPL